MLFTEKQWEGLANAHRRWNFKEGATRAGKTYLDYYLIPMRIRAVAGKDGLVVLLGHTRGTLQRNIIDPLQRLWGDKLVSPIRSDNTARLFGERCYCLGADKISQVDRLRGSGIKYCYGDEVATWNKEVFQMLKSRLDKPYSKFDGTCNPESPSHWLYNFLTNEKNLDLYRQSYQLDDNPTLDPLVVESLKKEYAGSVYYERFILGRWVRAEGAIYDVFDLKHIIDTQNIICNRHWVAVDYGTQNATAFLLIGQKGHTLYVQKEYYYSGRDTGRQKTDSEYATDLKAFIQGVPIENVVVDPSAASFIAELRRRNIPVRKADNAVKDGIRKVSSRFATDRLFIDRNCKNLIDELNGYAWDPKKDEEPLKEKDHACDALRYGVVYGEGHGFMSY